MKLFGEYLIDKGIISKTALLEGLIEQMRRLPRLAEILYQQELLPPEDILKTMSFHLEKRVDLKTACEKLHLWTPSVESSVTETLEMVRVPIGQILVEKGKVDFATMTQALDDFLSAEELTRGDKKKISKPKKSKRAASSSSGWEPELRPIAPLFLKNYTEFCSESRLGGLRILFEKLKENPKANSHALEKVSQEIHELKAVARFIKAHVSAQLMIELAATVDLFLEKPPKGHDEWSRQLADLGSKAVVLLKDLRAELLETESEKEFWKNSRGVFDSFRKELAHLKSK